MIANTSVNTSKLYVLVGFQASTKSTKALEILSTNPNSIILSRDTEGGSLISFIPKVAKEIAQNKTVIVDNTNLTREQRRPYIEIAKKYNITCECIYMKTIIEDCQIRVLHRMWTKFGKLLMTGRGISDPHIFPPSVLFAARKILEEPVADEGFTKITTIKVVKPTWDTQKYNKKALFLDIDGTLRATDHLINKYPVNENEVVLIKDLIEMRHKLDEYSLAGYYLIGVSNQSGIAKGILTSEKAESIFNRTRELLHYKKEELPILFCPHQSVPVTCYCRKPQSGLAMTMIESLGLQPADCIMVGDRGTDKTFAERLGMQFIHTNDFWTT